MMNKKEFIDNILNNNISMTLQEIFFAPQHTNFPVEDVTLENKLTRGLISPTSIISAAMTSITNDKLTIALDLYGCTGVLPYGLPFETRMEYLMNIKKYKAGFVTDVITVNREDTIDKIISLRETNGFSNFPVIDENNKVIGLINKNMYHETHDKGRKVTERMLNIKELEGYGIAIKPTRGISLKVANNKLIESKYGIMLILKQNNSIESAVFKEDIEKHYKRYGDFPKFVDSKKRLVAGIATSAWDYDRDETDELIRKGADFLVLDTAHGNADYVPQAAKYYKDKHGIQIMAGNISTGKDFNEMKCDYIDAFKVGRGVSDICSTGEMTGASLGQATSVAWVCKERDKYFKESGDYVPIWVDGTVIYPHDIVLSCLIGGDGVMRGTGFAPFAESAAPLKRVKGTFVSTEFPNGIEGEFLFKEYWGEASRRAKNLKRYEQKDETFVPEGIVKKVPYLGSIHDRSIDSSLPNLINATKRGVRYAGCKSIQELHEKNDIEIFRGSPEYMKKIYKT